MKNGVKAKGFLSDASNFNETQKLISEFIEEFSRIDILINNAGITKDNLLLRMSEADWGQYPKS